MKYKLEYFNDTVLCTEIIADYDSHKIAIHNYIDECYLRAFGVKENPTWEDYNLFLADRCIPATRDGLKYYLDALGLYEYDPFEVVKKTQGRMAEDHQWLKITKM